MAPRSSCALTPRVALRRVEVLVAQEILDLAQVRACVPLRLAFEVTLPQVGATGLDEQMLEFGHRQHVRQPLGLPRGAQRQGRIAHKPLFLDEEAKEALERRGRARLARDGRSARLLLGEERPQVGDLFTSVTAIPSRSR